MKVGLTLVVLAACSRGGTQTPPWADATQVTLRYNDSSVPPEYHRSYTITATRTSIRMVVDSYGKVISDHQRPLDAARFDQILSAIQRHGIQRAKQPGSTAGCSGGTSHRLEVTANGKALLAGSISRCGGTVEGDLAGASADSRRSCSSSRNNATRAVLATESPVAPARYDGA